MTNLVKASASPAAGRADASDPELERKLATIRARIGRDRPSRSSDD